MRGYFGIGVEGVTKHMNVGNLLRSANAFGASFVFTVSAAYSAREGGLADTSDTPGQVPFYEFGDIGAMRLPEGCTLVGIELTEAAVELPSFRHPRRAAYVLGMERGGLSPGMVDRCEHIVKIPTKFSLNLAAAGAVVMYDRLISVQRFGERPVVTGGPVESVPQHVHGQPVYIRRRRARIRADGG